jgi:hypothetical protein
VASIVEPHAGVKNRVIAISAKMNVMFFLNIISPLFLWFFSNLVGEEGSRVQGFKRLFFKDFISAFNIPLISAMSFLNILLLFVIL